MATSSVNIDLLISDMRKRVKLALGAVYVIEFDSLLDGCKTDEAKARLCGYYFRLVLALRSKDND